jgi:hypothetical protein
LTVSQSRGQKQIAEACPYGAVSWNEELQLAQAWPFDAHLLDQGWSRIRAEQVCVTGALFAQKLDDAAFEARRQEGWRELRPDLRTRPRVLYKGLERVETIFLAGSVEIDRDGARECFEGAKVELVREGSVVATTHTDEFGDFRIGGLKPRGAAMVRIFGEGCSPLELSVELERSMSIGRRLLGAVLR